MNIDQVIHDHDQRIRVLETFKAKMEAIKEAQADKKTQVLIVFGLSIDLIMTAITFLAFLAS